MQIEPRRVEPGFIKRWSKESISLIFRSPLLWGMIILLTFFGSQLTHPAWFFLFGGWLFMNSLDIAAQTDKFTIDISGFISLIINGTKQYLSYLQERANYIITFMIIIFIIDSYLSKFITPEVNSSLSIFTPMFSVVFYGYLFICNGGKLAGKLEIFSYLLKREFNSEETTAILATCTKASSLNPGVTLFFEVFALIGLTVCSFLLPIASIIFVGFIPAFVYVAFREIFLGQMENQNQTEPNQLKNLVPIKIPSNNS